MSKTAIRVDGLSKRYQLGTIGYGSLQSDLTAWWARVRGKEDPNTKIGEKSRLSLRGEFWALRDVGFEIDKGDRVGIIGRNGAGKSTLLKLLSRVTSPTAGSIRIRGKIASLLEVGTGFHPELTGRENVFLNGAILGMKRREIQTKFDEIVSFAGVEKFIDTPVKRYSSGMYVRLAFSVAAHLDSEILIIDEVLAVGDYDFQKKCLKKMEALSRNEGRTLFFVSHNLPSVLQLCNHGLLLQDGCLLSQGPATEVVRQYRSVDQEMQSSVHWVNLEPPSSASRIARVDSCAIVLENGQEADGTLLSEGTYYLKVQVTIAEANPKTSLFVSLLHEGELVFVVDIYQDPLLSQRAFQPGRKSILVKIPTRLLMDKEYEIEASLVIHDLAWSLPPRNGQGLRFNNLTGRTHPLDYELDGHPFSGGQNPSLLHPQLDWTLLEE